METPRPGNPPAGTGWQGWRGVVLVLVAVGLLMAALVTVIVVKGRSGSPVPLGRTGPIDPSARQSAPPVLNDGWFVEPVGMQMGANDLITDADLLPLYVGERLADAIVAAGFQDVRSRSYQAGSTGGGSARVIRVEDPDALLDAMRLEEPYDDLPQGRMTSSRLQVESTRAHDVWFHFREIVFFSDPYVVQIQMYATAEETAQRRIVDYARAEHELLQSGRTGR